jgi:glutamyl-tRNA synthetase
MMALRVAATGRAATPPLFETLAVLGKEVCRLRLRRAADALRAAPPAGARLAEGRP